MVINDWLNITKVEGEGSQKVTLTTPLNEGEERSTSLIISNGRKSKVVNIKQLKKSEEFKFEWFSKTFNNIPSTGSNADRVLTVFSCNAPCTLIRADIRNSEDYGMDFVTEETLEMTTGINNIYLNAESNVVNDVLQPVRMVVYIVLYKGEYQGTINIFQQGSTPTFTVTPNEIQFHKEGGIATIEITANTNWRIWGGGEYQPQITLDRTIGKSGTTIVTINAQEYEGVEELVYIMFVGMQGIANYSTPFTITQDSLDIPQDCFYIEPIDNEVRIGIGFRTYAANMNTNILPKMSFQYYQNGEWKTYNGYDYGTLDYFKENMLVITEKTFIKNFDKWSGGYINGTIENGTTKIQLGTLAIDGYCNIGGDIATLLGEMRYNYAYCLFSNLINASSEVNIFYLTPSIINAKDLILSPKITTNGAYADMFYGQSELLTPPIIKANDSNSSYINIYTLWDFNSMFYECNLTKAPIINVQGLRNEMVEGIFNSCNNINEITILGNLAPNFDVLEGYVYDDNDKLGVNGGIYYKSPNAPTPIVPSNWEVRDYDL